jgi:hypothetical protein
VMLKLTAWNILRATSLRNARLKTACG